jgi:hypothetical protein
MSSSAGVPKISLAGAGSAAIAAANPVCCDGRTRSEADDIRISIHEAGHATVARLLGVELGGVTIEAAGPFGGMVYGLDFFEKYADDTADISASAFCQKMSVLVPRPGEVRDETVANIYMHSLNRLTEIVAGTLAEKLLVPGEPWPAEHDKAQAESFANLICMSPESAAAFIALAKSMCADFLKPHLGIVTTLAEALRIERVMDGKRVDEVIAAALAKASVEEERARRAQWRAVEEGARRFEAMRECPLCS